MARCWHIRLALSAMVFALAHTATSQVPSDLPSDPSAFVQKLYAEVIRYQPLGILDYEYVGHPERKIVNGYGARKRFMPYLSQVLRHRIAVHDACMRDWDWQYHNANPPLKGPSFEGGIFSGSDERGGPDQFQIETVQGTSSGPFQVIVRLSSPPDPAKRDVWRVKVILVRNDDHIGVDDVLYLHGADDPRGDYRLTKYLSAGCKGPHWGGP